MASFRVAVEQYGAGALPKDHFVNTLYFTGDDPGPTGWTTLMGALHTAWSALPSNAYKQFTIKAYNMADPKPRPIVHSETYSGTDLAPGPTEVALCLSYYSTRNLPKARGRIYIGPFAGASIGAAYPSSTIVNANITLGTAIFTAGNAQSMVWSLYSPTDNQYLAITDTWVDNAWDTQRRRGLQATSRATHHLL